MRGVPTVDEYVERLARLAVQRRGGRGPGAGRRRLGWDVEQAPIVRAIAEQAYAAGARYVSAIYWDQHVKRSRLRHAPEDCLGFVPDWLEAVTAESVERRVGR